MITEICLYKGIRVNIGNYQHVDFGVNMKLETEGYANYPDGGECYIKNMERRLSSLVDDFLQAEVDKTLVDLKVESSKVQIRGSKRVKRR